MKCQGCEFFNINDCVAKNYGKCKHVAAQSLSRYGITVKNDAECIFPQKWKCPFCGHSVSCLVLIMFCSLCAAIGSPSEKSMFVPSKREWEHSHGETLWKKVIIE
jgi:hypothetical protein